ncbi:helix-turn-helix domain-containing protein [Brevibacillus laterosporus]|uniref:helix-turn-helix domain-containing protein n=1 Tax=Brevibacillus laterosporus TaxID=1465 RepID=UPI0037BF9653
MNRSRASFDGSRLPIAQISGLVLPPSISTISLVEDVCNDSLRTTLMKIGETLTKLRNKRHVPQAQMTDLSGVKRPRYNAWENDILQPDLEMIKK